MPSASPGADDLRDVVICGAGLAGLTLARQLRRQLPELSVTVLDRLTRPLPEAAFKVGESTVEVGAHYLAEVLELREYLEVRHLPKLGLRFFFGDAHGPFEARPELGLSCFPRVTSYQIDRGVLENDLRSMVVADGAELLEGCHVQEIDLGRSPEALHTVRCKRYGVGGEGSLRCRWVVDAMGRRRFLQRRLGLGKPPSARFNGVWFRFRGRVDVEELVAGEAGGWHRRVTEGERYRSTNHLMGDGYWVWLIPLSSGHTSVGIVTAESAHPFSGYNTYPRARRWLARREPALAAYLGDREPADFRRMGDYTYSSRQVFSAERWACVGEAGTFPDPFYSPGTDLIGLGNTLLAGLVEADGAGRLSPGAVEQANLFYLTFNDTLTHNIQLGYPFFGRAAVMACKLLWDVLSSWALTGPLMFERYFLNPAESAAVSRVTARFQPLSHRVQKLFVDWARRPGRATFDFLDYLSLPFARELRLRNLRSGRSTEDLVTDHRESLMALEELAQALFLLAVEDTAPQALVKLPSPPWVNAWAIGLDPERWEADGLFRPPSAPRDLARVREPLRACFRFEERPARATR